MNPPLRSVGTPIKPCGIPVHPTRHQQQQQPRNQEQQQQQSQQSSQLSQVQPRAAVSDPRRWTKPGQGRADAANSNLDDLSDVDCFNW